MININDVKNQKVPGFSVTFNDNSTVLEFDSSKEECFKIETNSNMIFNITSTSISNVEFYQVINGKTDINIEIKGEVEGNFRHIILLNNSNINIYFINNIKVDNSGKYEVIIIDLSQGNCNITNHIDAYNFSNANLLCASVVNKEYIKNINNYLTNKSHNTICNMDNYGVSFDKGYIKIKGVGAIEKNCYKSINEQKDTMFVLDKDSKVKCEPLLFIDEDDVVASHANALGQIDTEALFYLCSRGIKEDVAKKMVVLGYFKKFVEIIHFLDIKNELYNAIEEVTKNV